MKRLLTILSVLALLVAACGSGDTATEASEQLDSDAAPDGAAEAADGAGEGSDDATGDSAGDSTDGSDDSDDSTSSDDDGDDEAAPAEAAPGSLRSMVLGRALERSNELNSGRFEGEIEMVGTPGSELPGAITMTFSGAFDQAAGASEMSLDMSEMFTAAMQADPDAAEGMGALFSEMFAEPMQLIVVGDKSWIKWGLLAMFGVDDKWLEGDADAGTSMGMGSFGANDSPVGMLDDLADANADVEVVGQEEIRGVTTTHHRAHLDMAAMAAVMSDAERAEFEASFNGVDAEGTFLLDVWIDDDDLLHRFQLAITDLPPSAEADGMEAMTFVYDFWDHGVAVDIGPPPADQIVTEAELGFSLEDMADLAG